MQCSSARRALQMRFHWGVGRTLLGTGQGQRRKDGLWVYFWGILLCPGVKKRSKNGEVRSGRCHVSVGGSTGFKFTSELGFNTNYPTIVCALAAIVLIVLMIPNLAFMERTVHTMERGMLLKLEHNPERLRCFKRAGVLARCIISAFMLHAAQRGLFSSLSSLKMFWGTASLVCSCPNIVWRRPSSRGQRILEELCPSALSAYPEPPHTSPPPWSVPFPFSRQKPHPRPHRHAPKHLSHAWRSELHSFRCLWCIPSHLPGCAPDFSLPSALQSWKHQSWHSQVLSLSRGWGTHRDTGLATSLCQFRALFSMHGASAGTSASALRW